MKWDSRNGYPGPKLVQNVEKCDEEDLGEMFSMTSSQFAGKFVEFAVLAGGDSLRKFENFMKGTEYKRILNEEHLRKMRLKWRKNQMKLVKKSQLKWSQLNPLKLHP